MKFLSRSAVVLAMAAALVACDGKEKEQQALIEQLTTEIKQIEDAKTSVEGTLDSLTKERENILAEATAAKQSAADMVDKLRASNNAYAAAKSQNAKLLAQVNMWRGRADSLSKVNAALAAKVSELTTKVEEAEARATAAEARAEAAESKIREYEATLVKSYYVAGLDIKGYRGNDLQADGDRIKTSATLIKVSMAVNKPKGFNQPVNLTLKITDADGKVFYQTVLENVGDSVTHDVDIKGKNLDLDSGRHTVEVIDAKDNSLKLRSFFSVTKS